MILDFWNLISMSLFEGLEFYICLGAALIPAMILGMLGKPLKYYSFAATIFFVAMGAGLGTSAFSYLVLYVALEVLVVKGYFHLRKTRGRRKGTYYGALALSLSPLVLLKVSQVFQLNIFACLGISYLTFRTVQIIIETYDGLIEDMSLFDYLGFLLFFPCISSGPIDRSRRFLEDWNVIYTPGEYMDLAGRGMFKLLLGFIYKTVIGAQFFKLMSFCEGPDWYLYVGYAYAYGFYLFFDFAGYSLMAVGVSNIFGIKTPENFRKPFVARDIKDFWDRWHISLSHWFRDFVFSRFIMKCVKKKWFSTRLQRAAAGFMVNMGIMGMWHGLTPAYITYGLYHGALLALTEVYQKKSGFYKKYGKTKAYAVASWFITLQLVMFGFLIFSGHLI